MHGIYVCQARFLRSRPTRYINRQQDSFMKLSTKFDGTISQSGNMFDVVAKTQTTIYGFDIHSASNVIIPYEIYSRKGTHINHESSRQNWYMNACGSLQANGLGSPTYVAVDVPIACSMNERVSFYITIASSQGYLSYSTHGFTGDVFIENDALRIMEGVAVTYPFGTVYQDR